MTERLYYHDAYTTEFHANVVEQRIIEGQPVVILDRTYFYPTGGGQPHDLGTIDGISVVEVLTDEAGKSIIHILESAVDRAQVTGYLDWSHRFDHMQHHTGQHILTQAFVQVANANTVGFHLSPNSVTIDLDTINLSPESLAEAEALANRIVQENRPIIVRLVDPNNTGNIRIRRLPDQLLTEGLRVIEIEDFDMTACGGTHVAHSGEIGMIKVVKTTRQGKKLHVEFRCGERARHDYQVKNTVVNGLMSRLNCGAEELERAIDRLQDDLKQVKQARKAAIQQLIPYEAEVLLANAQEYADFRLVKAIFDRRDADELRMLTNHLILNPGTVALLGVSGETARILMARSSELDIAMNELLKQIMSSRDDVRGGGDTQFAQGGGFQADRNRMQTMLNEAHRFLLEIVI